MLGPATELPPIDRFHCNVPEDARAIGPQRHEETAMKIAQIAPLMESIPPRLYGGSERVVSYLTEELVAQGHDVTLFASGQSITSAKLGALLRAAAAVEPDRQGHHSLLHADARQGSQHGERVRHPAFPHRPVPLPDLPRDGASHGHDAARPPGPARSPPPLSRFSRHAAGLDLRTRSARRSPTPTLSAPSITACRETSP